jgi:hypothetical protein
MLNTIPIEEFTQNLFELLGETFEQVSGRYMEPGATLFETLATISAEEASRPVGTCATLAAQVEHVRFYLEVAEHYLLGKEDRSWDWGEIWRTVSVVTAEEWTANQQKLRDTYQRVLGLMKSFDTWAGEDRVGHAMNMLVHTAYHLGNIRQALCTLKSR